MPTAGSAGASWGSSGPFEWAITMSVDVLNNSNLFTFPFENMSVEKEYNKADVSTTSSTTYASSSSSTSHFFSSLESAVETKSYEHYCMDAAGPDLLAANTFRSFSDFFAAGLGGETGESSSEGTIYKISLYSTGTHR
jgi:hypothetical protein